MNKTQLRHDATCATCKYFLEQEHETGSCHRYPPAFAGEQTPRELHRWRFPAVSTRSWCGEHKPADPQAPAFPCDSE